MAPILIVDDDEAIRETLRFLLEDAGYEVEEAEDGVAALARLRASARPMVVLLDLMMPRMNGDQTLAAVAGDPTLRAFHEFIMVTASPRARLLTVGRPGAHMTVPCIEKPFDLDGLLSAVARAEQRISPPNLTPEALAFEAIG
jgi:two-component system chemotaxis response regulator CheY